MRDVFCVTIGLFVGLTAWSLYDHILTPALSGVALLVVVSLAWKDDEKDGIDTSEVKQ